MYQQQFQAYNQPGRQPPQDSPHYGQYGTHVHNSIYTVKSWQAMQFQTEMEFQQVFDHQKSQRFNAIQAQELMHILNNTPQIRAYYKISWSLELCKVMLAMLDRSRNGMMEYKEFQELLQCLVYWYMTFCDYDRDHSGYIEANELGTCIRERLRYSLTPTALQTLLKRYARVMDDGRLLMAFDDFVSCCVRLRAYTEAFRQRDRLENQGGETGRCTFDYDDFLQCVMCL